MMSDNFLRKLAMWERQSKHGIEDAMINLSGFEAICEMPDRFNEKKLLKRTFELYIEKEIKYLESCGLLQFNRLTGYYEKSGV